MDDYTTYNLKWATRSRNESIAGWAAAFVNRKGDARGDLVGRHQGCTSPATATTTTLTTTEALAYKLKRATRAAGRCCQKRPGSRCERWRGS